MNFQELKDKFHLASEKFKSLEKDAQLEVKDNYVAAEILLKILERKQVSEEQIKFLKEQSIDFTKVLAIIGLQAVPGSSIVLILLEKEAKKYGIDILPNPRSTPKM